MRKETRFKFNQYMSRIAELNGVEVADLNKKFNVEPSVTQTLFDKIQQSSSFLKLINMVTVGELTEEKVGIDVTGTIASNADTANGVERQTADFSKLDAYRYFCKRRRNASCCRCICRGSLACWKTAPAHRTTF